MKPQAMSLRRVPQTNPANAPRAGTMLWPAFLPEKAASQIKAPSIGPMTIPSGAKNNPTSRVCALAPEVEHHHSQPGYRRSGNNGENTSDDADQSQKNRERYDEV